MEGLTDIHCHMLPHVDDGARSEEEAMAMLKAAYADGIRTIILTPHFRPERWKWTAGDFLHAWESLAWKAVKKWPDLKLFVGNELYYRQEIQQMLSDGQCLTMAKTRYALTEFSPSQHFPYMRDAVCELTAQGYLPILAHVERYECLEGRMDRIEELSDRGAYLQANADSILKTAGVFGNKFLKKLLKKEYIDFIGSDSHDLKSRPPSLSRCADYIQKKFNREYAERILFQNPKRLLEDKEL
ncbi:CpsB/CapC family capsule biosynthesis tyrosine phosphatase [Lachnotalea sp. AF33-28]|uniref:CpsB/CapC family capsule biosynthesis tyrosine phosphatase n=1 Tax=Lachnotalea sp. AF33-28 TaxID=2292046 RepID=UPI0011C3F8B6|nr:CpsB/CapC family capsule biosynthesis tyrosine phosphatase [Lachnotalea sp. AF33-28]